MTENKRYRKVMGLIENTDGKTFDLTEIENLLNGQEEEIKNLKLENQLLLEEMKEIRDKLTLYLKIKGVDVE